MLGNSILLARPLACAASGRETLVDDHTKDTLAVVLDATLRGMCRTHPRRAQAWMLVNLRGLTHQEAAEVLGVSQQRVSLANEQARATIEKELS